MADTAPIEETFGLIAVDEFGGKVRLYTEAEIRARARRGILLQGERKRRRAHRGQYPVVVGEGRSPPLLEGRNKVT